jgi:hypothetical protein
MRDAPPELFSACTSGERQALSDLIESLIGRRPSEPSLGRIIAATPRKTVSEAIEATQEAVLKGCGAESKQRPQSVSWFVSVVRSYWADRERRALPPAAVDKGMDSAEFGSMTAAIELPDAIVRPLLEGVAL